jgi:glycosyltransferase involved in cell wall biosynthesis
MNNQNKVKVCHLTSVHKRYDMRIFQKECISITNNGYEVTLIVADNKGDEIKNDVAIYDVGKSSGRIKRFTHTLNKVYRKAMAINASVYHFHDPELLLVGLKLKRAGKKVIWDMHENLPADIMQKKYIPLPLRLFVTYVFKKLERYTVKRIDGIICTRDSVLFRLYDLNSTITLVNNFPLINYSPEIPNKRERAICFAGAIVPNYQHKEIIEAIAEIDNVKYILAGPIKEAYLNVLKATKGWEKVEYLGVLSFEEVKQVYAKAQIGMVVHKYTPNMDYQVGNFALTKIFEVMYWAMPVIATDYSLWQETVFEHYDCAIPVDPTVVLQIKLAIESLLNNPTNTKTMGIEGQKAVIEKFNWLSQEKKLLKLYDRVLSNN